MQQASKTNRTSIKILTVFRSTVELWRLNIIHSIVEVWSPINSNLSQTDYTLFLCRSFPFLEVVPIEARGPPAQARQPPVNGQGKARREVLRRSGPLHPPLAGEPEQVPLHFAEKWFGPPPLWLASQKAPTRRSALLATSTIPSRDTSQAREVPPFMEPPPRISAPPGEP